MLGIPEPTISIEKIANEQAKQVGPEQHPALLIFQTAFRFFWQKSENLFSSLFSVRNLNPILYIVN